MAALPAYRFRPDPPSLLDMARRGLSDVASVMPEAILDRAAIKLPGPGAPLVVADPDLARTVLNDKSGQFVRDRFTRRLFRRTWDRGLAGAEGEPWQAQRRAAAPFFKQSAMAGRIDGFRSNAAEVLATRPGGGLVKLDDLARRIVARVVFTQLVAAASEVDPDEVAGLMPAYIARVASFGAADIAPLPEAWIDRLRGLRRDPSVARIRDLAREVANRRAAGGPRGDLIDLLAVVGPVEDNVRGLLPAAMDTTVAGLTWTLYCLAAMPEWQDRLGGAEPAELQSFVKEVLRLFPPAPQLVRASSRAGELGGFRVRKGQPVLVSIYAMQRHRGHWRDPDSFLPERFVPPAPRPDAYMPFGTGPRMCIAAQFAELEIASIAAEVLARFRIAPEGSPPEVSLLVATRPVGGVVATLIPR